MILHALGSEQMRPSIDPLTGKSVLGPDGKPIMVPFQGALVTDIGEGYQVIGRLARQGKNLDQFLRMMRDMHEIMADQGGGRARHRPAAGREVHPAGR